MTTKKQPEGSPQERTRAHLSALLRELRAAQSVVIVCETALRHDSDCIGVHVADLLQRAASNRLDVEIERTARYLVSIGGVDEVFTKAGPVD